MNLLPRKVELSWIVEGQMHKKKISCQVFINFYRKIKLSSPLLQAFAKMKWHQKMSENGWILKFSHLAFSDFSSAFFILFALVNTTLRQRMFYNFKYLKEGLRRKMSNAKHGVRVNPTNHRKTVRLNLRLEGRSVWQIEQYKCNLTREILSLLA